MKALDGWRNAIQEITDTKMTKQLYIIDYDNAHWCGGNLNVVVWARDEDHAVEVAEWFMDEQQRELFLAEFEEEPEAAEDCGAL